MKKTNAVRILDRHKVPYQLVEYQYDPEDLSVDRIAEDNQLPAKQLFKTLVAKGNKTGVLVAVIPGDKTLDFKEISKVSRNKKVTMALKKEIQGLTGYVRGGCSPIGMKKNFPVFLDEKAMEFERIYINAGVRGLFLLVKPQDLQVVTESVISNICS